MNIPATARVARMESCAENGPRPIQTIAIAGGKGGVGKSNVAVNLAAAMGGEGKSILLMDGDFELGNIDTLLNLKPAHNLLHVVGGERSLDDILIKGPAGVSVIPNAAGVMEMARLSQIQHADLIRLFSDLGSDADTLLIDNATGLSESVLSFSRAAREVIVVVADEPTSIQDAFATIRVLNESCQVRRFRIVANKTESSRHGLDLYATLTRHADRHLDVLLDFCGSIPFDPQLKQAVCQQRTVVEAFPRSPSAMAFRKLSSRISRWPRPDAPCGRIEFFIERLIQAAVNTG